MFRQDDVRCWLRPILWLGICNPHPDRALRLYCNRLPYHCHTLCNLPYLKYHSPQREQKATHFYFGNLLHRSYANEKIERSQGHNCSITHPNCGSMFSVFIKLMQWMKKKTTPLLVDSKPHQTVEVLDDDMETSSTVAKTLAQVPDEDGDEHGPVKDLADIFHLYGKLAPEIRLNIWAHYLEEETYQMFRFALRYLLGRTISLCVSVVVWRNEPCTEECCRRRLQRGKRGDD